MGSRLWRLHHFNPRSSCEERQSARLIRQLKFAFQSTLLMRGATWEICNDKITDIFQSTLLMRGATSSLRRASHASTFQSTLLMRGATRESHRPWPPGYFNPRSSCEERLISLFCASILSYFNPRSSCEERLVWRHPRLRIYLYFNPRSSCEERLGRAARDAPRHISIHAPHARSDSVLASIAVAFAEFQSTLLMRGATWYHCIDSSYRYFNPRSSCEERLLIRESTAQQCFVISIHAPHARSDFTSRHGY